MFASWEWYCRLHFRLYSYLSAIVSCPRITSGTYQGVHRSGFLPCYYCVPPPSWLWFLKWALRRWIGSEWTCSLQRVVATTLSGLICSYRWTPPTHINWNPSSKCAADGAMLCVTVCPPSLHWMAPNMATLQFQLLHYKHSALLVVVDTVKGWSPCQCGIAISMFPYPPLQKGLLPWVGRRISSTCHNRV